MYPHKVHFCDGSKNQNIIEKRKKPSPKMKTIIHHVLRLLTKIAMYTKLELKATLLLAIQQVRLVH